MSKVFVLGSLNMDFIISVDKIPKLGQTIQGNDFKSSPGGKGSNQAVSLAKQGVDTYMIGSVGNDLLGQEIKLSLKQYGVHCEFLSTVETQESGIALIVVENNDNRIMTSAGANAIHDSDKIKGFINDCTSKNDILLAQLEIPLDIIEQAFVEAKANGVKTFLNAAPIKPLPETILEKTDFLIVNESEGESLLDKEIDFNHIEQSLIGLKNLGPKEVILTLGAKGSYYINDQSTYHMPAFFVEDVIDTTGAGDAYIGCLVSGLIDGKDVLDAMKLASACGAITVQKKGVHHAIPYPNMIDDFLKKRENL